MFLFPPTIFCLIMAFSVASINVNGMAERHKCVKVFESLRQLNFNVFLLQETHLADYSQGKS